MRREPAHLVTVRHNFETAHRLPDLGGKCRNLHGHSWWCEITVAANHLQSGIVVEFSEFKSAIRTWVDAKIDHGAMLGSADPLVGSLTAEGCKVFRFGAADAGDGEEYAEGLTWPTVENVALMLSRMAEDVLRRTAHSSGAEIASVRVTETNVNSAAYTWQ